MKEGMRSDPACLRNCLRLVAIAGVVAFSVAVAPDVSMAQTKVHEAPIELDVTVYGIKSDKGEIRIAVCPAEGNFPDCGRNAVGTATVPVHRRQARANFPGLPPGLYAISVFHDANGNGRLDTFLGVPREGYGFSRNPRLRMRAPRFNEAQILLKATSAIDIDLRYIL